MKEMKGTTTINMKDGKTYLQYLNMEEAVEILGGRQFIVIEGRDIFDNEGRIVDFHKSFYEKVDFIEMRYYDKPIHLVSTAYISKY